MTPFGVWCFLKAEIRWSRGEEGCDNFFISSSVISNPVATARQLRRSQPPPLPSFFFLRQLISGFLFFISIIFNFISTPRSPAAFDSLTTGNVLDNPPAAPLTLRLRLQNNDLQTPNP